MTHVDRKLAAKCTHHSCDDAALPDHNLCKHHRDLHRARCRRWKWRMLTRALNQAG